MKIGLRALGPVFVAALAAACTTTPTPSPPATTSPDATSIATFDPLRLSATSVGAWSGQDLIVVGSTAGEGAVASSSDGGATWLTESRGMPPLGSVTTSEGRSAWALGACPGDPCSASIFLSRNAGGAWAELPTPVAFRSIAFGDTLHGVAVPREGEDAQARTPYVTDDGGQTWRPTSSACPPGWVPVATTAQSGVAWVACSGGGATIMEPRAIVQTHDGGVSWQVIALNDPSTGARIGTISADGHLTGITVVEDHLWSWASRGVLSHSVDAGRTWSDLPLGSPDVVEVASAAFVSDNDGFALVWDADVEGALLEATHDGGQTWAVVATFER